MLPLISKDLLALDAVSMADIRVTALGLGAPPEDTHFGKVCASLGCQLRVHKVEKNLTQCSVLTVCLRNVFGFTLMQSYF